MVIHVLLYKKLNSAAGYDPMFLIRFMALQAPQGWLTDKMCKKTVGISCTFKNKYQILMNRRPKHGVPEIKGKKKQTKIETRNQERARKRFILT